MKRTDFTEDSLFINSLLFSNEEHNHDQYTTENEVITLIRNAILNAKSYIEPVPVKLFCSNKQPNLTNKQRDELFKIMGVIERMENIHFIGCVSALNQAYLDNCLTRWSQYIKK